MSLLDKAMEVMGTFNPETDKVSDFEEIADGTYQAMLEEVTSRKSEAKGTEWISFKYSVIDDSERPQYIWVNQYFTEKSQDRSIKQILKTAHEFGYQLPAESFESLDTLAETLNQMAGETAEITKKTSSSGFANYVVKPN